MDDHNKLTLSRRRLLQTAASALAVANEAVGSRGLLMSEAEAGGPASNAGQIPVADYILQRLKQHGATKLFGVPGKTCEALFDRAASVGIDIVLTSSDLEAGYAADGFARMAGLGAVTVTHGVGTLSLANAIAGAYAERSPVAIINGGPSDAEVSRQINSKISFTHSVGRRRTDGTPPTAAEVLTDLAIFKNLTAYAGRAAEVQDVPQVVGEALTTALKAKRPVYIEISKNAWEGRVAAPGAPLSIGPDPTGMERAVASDILDDLRGARRPVVMLGIELQRYGLVDQVARLINKLGLPWTTTLLAKAVIPESTPGFFGVYDGTSAPKIVRDIIGQSDLILMLGCMFGVQYVRLLSAPATGFIRVAEREARFTSRRPIRQVDLAALMSELNGRSIQPSPNWETRPTLANLSFDARRAPRSTLPPINPSEPGVTYDTAMRAISDQLDATFLTITDTSLSMQPGADLNISGAKGFLCNAVWQAIGFSVAAAIGAGLAPGARRPLVICGDGGFQMTVQALSTIARRNIPAVVLVLDNGLYAIEQNLIDSSYFSSPSATPLPYLVLQPWAYGDIAIAMGFERNNVRKVAAISELESALQSAREATKPFFVHVLVKAHDLPAELRES